MKTDEENYQISETLKQIVLTAPKEERGRVISMVTADLEEITSKRTNEAIRMLYAVASDLYYYENQDQWDKDLSDAGNEAYLKLASKIGEIYEPGRRKLS